ncbi:hypothetical protein HU200_027016 [Digitaria exilis]|uniref:Uncharacterized protein n=1 Tax=Digitaria exilis TaxID=1010633 RepID=A0A835C208_9POAL|nr:hypothetical protein HU200_027016 [Digitaria exilis]
MKSLGLFRDKLNRPKVFIETTGRPKFIVRDDDAGTQAQHPNPPNATLADSSHPATHPIFTREMSTGGADKPGSGAGAGGAVKTPSDFLKSIRGRPVVVKLNSGVDYRVSPNPS